MKSCRIDWKYLIGAGILVVFVFKSSGAGASNLMGTLLVLDLGIAAVAVFSGIMRQDYGRIVGGSVCGLMALSSASSIRNLSGVDIVMQIAGGILGVGSFVISGSRRSLNR